MTDVISKALVYLASLNNWPLTSEQIKVVMRLSYNDGAANMALASLETATQLRDSINAVVGGTHADAAMGVALGQLAMLTAMGHITEAEAKAAVEQAVAAGAKAKESAS